MVSHCKPHLKEVFVFELCPKVLLTKKTGGFFKLQYPKSNEGDFFCMLLDIIKANKFNQSFYLVLGRYTETCPTFLSTNHISGFLTPQNARKVRINLFWGVYGYTAIGAINHIFFKQEWLRPDMTEVTSLLMYFSFNVSSGHWGNKLVQYLKVDVVYHFQGCPGHCKILNWEYCKKELRH